MRAVWKIFVCFRSEWPAWDVRRVGGCEDAAHEVPDLKPRPCPSRPRHLPSPAEDRGLPAQGQPGDTRVKTIKVLNATHLSEHFQDSPVAWAREVARAEGNPILIYNR